MANRVKEDAKNERIIRNLLKVPENRRCINCNSLGPQYVCTNFSTFICTTCSGIHREFTHRVKSVSMAKFTPQEVSALQGGGNASAREIYFKEWDPQRNSLPDASNIERLRDFIKHMYVDRRYTGEKTLEKPLWPKGETDDISGNRRVDVNQGGSRSPPYYRSSLGGKSPGYDQDNWQYGDYKKSPGRSEVVNDWRIEDRFSNGRKLEDRNSDGGSKIGSRSPDSQSSDMSSPPAVRPVREILGENVSPLRVIEPPKTSGVKLTDISAKTQRTASSGSLSSSDGNPSTIKVEASFIDLDSVTEPVAAATVPQTQPARKASAAQPTTAGGNWANFEPVSAVKSNTVVSNSVESLFSELSVTVLTSGPPVSVGKSLPFHSIGSDISLFDSNFGSFAAPTMFPSGGASASSLPELLSASIEGSLVTEASVGGQWPVLHGASGLSAPVATVGVPSSNMTGNQLEGPTSHPPRGPAVTQAGQAVANPMSGIYVSLSTESSPELKSGGRKELPADLFTLGNSYLQPQVSGWYSGSPYVTAGPMHYNLPMAAPNFQQVPRSTNPFDFSNERPLAQVPTFPPAASMHGALSKFPASTGLMRPSGLGASSSLPSTMFSQPPSYTSQIPPASFFGQELAGSTMQRPLGPSGFSLSDPAFPSLNPSHQAPTHSAPSHYTSTGGNPFG